MDIDSLRKLVPATKKMVYMNTGWAGPSPEPVVERARQVLRQESEAGPAGLDGLRLAATVRDEAQAAVAALVRADPREMLLTHGTTEGVNIVLHGLPWEPGDELVTCDLEHPALHVPAVVLAERKGVVAKVVEIAPRSSADEIVSAVQDALGSRTRLVALSHVQYSCGLRMPIREIAEAVHRAGALLLVDGAQTAGQIALDMGELGADFYAVSGQKWLLGPLGTGALFVGRDHWERLSASFTTPEAQRQAEARGYHALRWPLELLQATASQSVALLAGLTEAIKLLTGFGIETVEKYCLALATRLRHALSEIPGCTITSPETPELSSGLVSVSVEGWEPQALVDELWESWRIAARAVTYPAGVRFSTAPFNTEAEVDLLAQALLHIVSRGPGASRTSATG